MNAMPKCEKVILVIPELLYWITGAFMFTLTEYVKGRFTQSD